MNDSIKVGYFNIEGLRLHPDLIDNWNEIVLNSGEHSLVDVDIETLGSKLKELIKDNGMYVLKCVDILILRKEHYRLMKRAAEK